MDTASASPLLPHLKVHDGRKTMRSMADALQKLTELGVLGDGQNAQVKVSEISFPDRKTSSGVVSVVAPLRPDGSGWAIWMPSSSRFKALDTMGIRRTYGIGLLDNAFSDRDGNVDLGGGQFLHTVEFVPTPFYRFTDLQHAIVYFALKFLQVEDQCTFSPYGDLWPSAKSLDYIEISKLKVRNIKALIYYIEKRLRVSPHTIEATLRRAGMKFPRSRGDSATVAP